MSFTMKTSLAIVAIITMATATVTDESLMTADKVAEMTVSLCVGSPRKHHLGAPHIDPQVVWPPVPLDTQPHIHTFAHITSLPPSLPFALLPPPQP